MDEITNREDAGLAARSTRQELVEESRTIALMCGMLSVVNLLPDITLVLDRHCQVVFANAAALKLVNGGAPETALGLRLGELLDCKNVGDCDGGCGTSEVCTLCGARKAILTTHHGTTSLQECQIIQNKSGDALDLRVWAFPLS